MSATTRGCLGSCCLSVAQTPSNADGGEKISLEVLTTHAFTAAFNVLHGRVLQKTAFGSDTNSYVDSQSIRQ